MQDGNDIGPLTLENSLSVLAVKEKLVSDWPKELTKAEPGKEAPTSANDLKLILSGQVLENTKTLSELKMPVTPDSVVTMHLVVRIPLAPQKAGDPGSKEAEKVTKCTCTIV